MANLFDPFRYFEIYGRSVDKDPTSYEKRRDNFKCFLSRYNISKLVTSRCCLQRLGNDGRGRCKTNILECFCTWSGGGWQDHQNLWADNNGRSIVYTSQPYDNPSREHLSPLEYNNSRKFIEDNNLKVEIFDKENSFYFPDRTYLIVISNSPVISFEPMKMEAK